MSNSTSAAANGRRGRPALQAENADHASTNERPVRLPKVARSSWRSRQCRCAAASTVSASSAGSAFPLREAGTLPLNQLRSAGRRADVEARNVHLTST